jgi:hypothetical protein
MASEVTQMIRSMNPVQPRSLSSHSFDFEKIDRPEEAMVMPGGDLWVGLVLGPLPGKVTVTSGDQSLSYETHPGPNKLHYQGQINGQAFTLEGTAAQPRGIRVKGETPAGSIDSLRRGGGGGFGLDGRTGAVEFSQMLALDRSGGASGKLAYLGGTVGGQQLEAWARKEDDGTVEVSGTLGEIPVNQTIRTGPNDEWIIKGTIGSSDYTEIIERY